MITSAKGKELSELDNGRLGYRADAEVMEPEVEPEGYEPHEWDTLLSSPRGAAGRAVGRAARTGCAGALTVETKHRWATAAALAANRLGFRGDAPVLGSGKAGAEGTFSGSLFSGPWALRSFMAVVLTIIYSLIMISLTAAKRQGTSEGFRFEFVTVTLLQETSKMTIAGTLWFLEIWSTGGRLAAHRHSMRLGTFLGYAVPGLLYCVENNFQYVILGFLQPAELAVIWNFKIFATVVLMHVFLHRRYAQHQWVAMGVLVAGCALTQTHTTGLHSADSANATAAVITAVTAANSTDVAGLAGHGPKFVGAVLGVIGSCIAASSNVFCEWLVKQHPEDSINLQNLQLYFFGVVMNSVALIGKVIMEPESPVHGPGGFFTGYNSWVWVIVILGSVSGLTISVALKFVDNLVLIFSHAISVLVVALVSMHLFGTSLPAPFILGGTLVLVALLMFHSGEQANGSDGSGSGARPVTMANSFNRGTGGSVVIGGVGAEGGPRGTGGAWAAPASRLGGSSGRAIPMYCIT